MYIYWYNTKVCEVDAHLRPVTHADQEISPCMLLLELILLVRLYSRQLYIAQHALAQDT